MAELLLSPQDSFSGEVAVPGDKSISHRVLLLSSIANGISQIQGICLGQDCLTTMAVLRELGVKIELDDLNVQIHGGGKQGLMRPSQPLDCQNSGTSLRLLMGLLSGSNITCELIGDESLSLRPMARVAIPLSQMGAKISMSASGTLPIAMHSNQGLQGISYELPVASAQVKSAILLAGLYAKGDTHIIEPILTRDHTERLLRLYRYPCERKGQCISISSAHELQPIHYEVPGDLSAAAFLIVAACIVPHAAITIRHVGINPTRTGILHILSLMGADITFLAKTQNLHEPVADILVRFAPLVGVVIPATLVPLAIDEFPIIFIAAACAHGVTQIHGLQELRVKETDRLHRMVQNLQALGISAQELDDGIRIQGGKFEGGTVDSYGDHRIAMAMMVASLVAKDHVVLRDPQVVAVSYPNFCQTLSILTGS